MARRLEKYYIFCNTCFFSQYRAKNVQLICRQYRAKNVQLICRKKCPTVNIEQKMSTYMSKLICRKLIYKSEISDLYIRQIYFKLSQNTHAK